MPLACGVGHGKKLLGRTVCIVSDRKNRGGAGFGIGHHHLFLRVGKLDAMSNIEGQWQAQIGFLLILWLTTQVSRTLEVAVMAKTSG